MTSSRHLVPDFTLFEWLDTADLVFVSLARTCIAPSVGPTRPLQKNLDFIVCIKSLVFFLGYFGFCILNLPLKIVVKLLGWVA